MHSKGSALLSALFIMTLVAIAATAMSMRLQLDIYRTHLTITSDKLYLASQEVTFWAMDTLNTKKPFLSKQATGKIFSFPRELQRSYPDIALTGDVYDLQTRFNLNNLLNKKLQPQFLKLLENTLPKANSELRKSLLNSTVLWISPYQPESGQDISVDFYLGQKPPYLPSHQPMKNLSEFRLVHGVTPQIYQALLPYLTVLPEEIPININTAPKALLKILGNGLTDAQVDELLKTRREGNKAEANNMNLLLQKLDIPQEQITTESQYFLSVASATTASLTLTNYTLIKRIKNNQGAISISILNENLNTL